VPASHSATKSSVWSLQVKSYTLDPFAPGCYAQREVGSYSAPEAANE
jgi:hypothetical protein